MAERTRKSQPLLLSSDYDAGASASRKSTSNSGNKKKLNMASQHELPVIFCLIFLSLLPGVEAYDAGDALALLLGTILTVMGFCVFLGWYARRRNDQL